MIKKITIPTTKLPPATKSPKVWMIFPAFPCSNINLVDATLRERRNSVMNRSSAGKVDNSRASFVHRVIIKTATERDILQARSISNNGVGMRINSVARIVIIPTAITILLREFDTVLSSPGFGKLDVSETAITIYSPVQSLLGLFLVRSDIGPGPENFLYSDSEPVFDYNNISGSEPDVFQIQIRRYINGFIEFQY